MSRASVPADAELFNRRFMIGRVIRARLGCGVR